jgi:replicative DNA helicase
MALTDEDRTLVSLLTSHPADVLPLTRLPYFADLFPGRKAQAVWINEYLELNGVMPSFTAFKRTHSGILDKPIRPEPLRASIDTLRDQLVDALTTDSAGKMQAAYAKNAVDDYVKIAEDMADKIRVVRMPVESSAVDASTWTEQQIARLDKDAGSVMRVLPTGFPPLDRELGGGLCGGRLYVLSSLISLGKTYVTLGIAENIRRHPARVGYFSLEMSHPDIAERALCLRYGLNVDQYIKKTMPEGLTETREVWYKGLLLARRALEKLDPCTGKLFIRDNQGAVTPKMIRSDVKELKLDAVFIDAAQDLRDNGMAKERTMGLYSALTELNSVASESSVPIFMTVQMSAEVEQKGLTKGNLTRIQWGQVFAQKAHIVMSMLGDRSTTRREVTMDKTRDGQPGRPFIINMNFPDVKITAEDLSAVGVTITEADVFDNPDDLKNYEDVKPPTDSPAKPPQMPQEAVSTPEPPSDPPRETLYAQRVRERQEKKAKNKLHSFKKGPK